MGFKDFGLGLGLGLGLGFGTEIGRIFYDGTGSCRLLLSRLINAGAGMTGT